MRLYPCSRPARGVVVAFVAAFALAVLGAGSAFAGKPTFARTVSCSASAGETTVSWSGPHFRSVVVKFYSADGLVVRSDLFIVSGSASLTDTLTPSYAVRATAFFQRHGVVDEATGTCS